MSYQSILTGAGSDRRAEDSDHAPGPTPLPPGAIRTRRKDADRALEVRISKEQRDWLREVEELSGKGVDRAAVVRALIDLGRELPVDWALVAGGAGLREAVRRSVLVVPDGRHTSRPER